MVHSTSGFRGTRVGVTQGAGLKNQGDDPLGEPLPRIYVSYWCAMGHETRPVFVKLPDEEIPGGAAGRRRGIRALRRRRRPQTTASKRISNTLKKDAPARTPRTFWPERCEGYEPAGAFRTSCWGTRAAAFSSISQSVRERPAGPAAGT